MKALAQARGWASLVALLTSVPSTCVSSPFPDTLLTPQSQVQQPLSDNVHTRSPGHLHGRFMHITDFHPDRFYKTYSSTSEDSACHRSSGTAGFYGAETTDCDSPIALVNATFDWLAKHVRDEIDFIIWTGDSARHDNDESLPRTNAQIKDLNSLLVHKFEEVFGRERDNDDPYDDYIVPIVPNLGNNDILPHNIFDLGPNEWTRTYLDLWKSFVPEEERHEFDQSGWFAVDVIPDYLTVFSLNTLYFYDKNAAVDGCSLRGEPGYRQMEWLRVQLQFLRERGMKAMLIGHVPPARTEGKMNWDETCWQKYALWMRQYRDVVVGSFYGHMNIDHFIVQDFDDIDPSLDKGVGIEAVKSKSARGEVSVQSASSYVQDLRAWWSQLPKKPKGLSRYSKRTDQADLVRDMSDDARPDWEVDTLVKNDKVESDKGKKKKKKKKGDRRKDRHSREKNYLRAIGGDCAERFAVSFVSPSIIPNYFPTYRIYEYNTTGVDYRPPIMSVPRPKMVYDDLDAERTKKGKKTKRRIFTVPEPPSRSSPPGPAYSPQSLSIVGYQQWYANLTTINNDVNSKDLTAGSTDRGSAIKTSKWKDGHSSFKKRKGKGKPHPKKFEFEVLYNTTTDEVYELPDLTVRSWIELAEKMSSGIRVARSDSLQEKEESQPWSITGHKKDQGKMAGKKGKKGSRSKKDKQNKAKKGKMNKVWFSFIQRAFVGTMSDQDIKDEFGG